MKHLPDEEQLKSLSQFRSDYNSLCEPEQFAVVVSTFLLDHFWGSFLCKTRENNRTFQQDGC